MTLPKTGFDEQEDEPYIYGTVYVPQVPLTSNGGSETVRPRFSLRPAEKYGKLLYLFEWCDVDDMDPAALLYELRSKLRDFGDDDYLMMVGNPTLMVLSAMIAAEMNEGRVRILYWRREQRRYNIVNINMESPPPR